MFLSVCRIASEDIASMQQSDSNAQDSEHCPSIVELVETGTTILNHLPPILPKGYFEPRRGKITNDNIKTSEETKTFHHGGQHCYREGS